MRAVYKAQVAILDRLVVLEFLPQHTSALDHPGVCTTYESKQLTMSTCSS